MQLIERERSQTFTFYPSRNRGVSNEPPASNNLLQYFIYSAKTKHELDSNFCDQSTFFKSLNLRIRKAFKLSF